jgi:hypothetical protein
LTVLRSTAAAAALLLLVTIGHVADAPPASACSCGALGDTDDADAFAAADAVFVAQVLDFSTRRSKGLFDDPALWLFRVEHVYKGSVAERHGVLSLVSPACGLAVPRTGRVLVFASRPPERFASIDGADLYAHGCSGSRALESHELPVMLGDSVPPRPGVGGARSLNESRGRAGPIVVAALALAGVSLATGLRRRWRVARR